MSERGSINLGHILLINVSYRPGIMPGALWYAHHGKEVPEDALPGRELMRMSQKDRESVIRAVNSSNQLAGWAFKDVGITTVYDHGRMRC